MFSKQKRQEHNVSYQLVKDANNCVHLVQA
jgi:hypothetical protein